LNQYALLPNSTHKPHHTTALTQMLGMVQTSTVQTSIKAGKAMSVEVRPKRLITMPVPNSENKNEMEFVVCVHDGREEGKKRERGSKSYEKTGVSEKSIAERG